LKCHWCKKELEETYKETDPVNINRVISVHKECPDGHSAIVFKKSIPIFYEFFVFSPDESKRYKIEHWTSQKEPQTRLSAKRGKWYNEVMLINTPITLEMTSEGDPDVHRLLKKLQSLIIFS